MDSMGMATALIAGLSGVVAGAGLAWRVIGARATARYNRLVTAAREQVAASTKNLRAANSRLQAELDHEKIAARQRQAAFSAEQRASVTRLEGQLRFAYAEIDRLNAATRGGSSGSHNGSGGNDHEGVTDGHGFALTRPFVR